MLQSNHVLLLHIFVVTVMMEIVSAASMGRLKTDEIEYQGFKSKITPDHGVRYVNPQLCDPNVTQHSGYFDMGPENQFFFWFFESKHEPETKPLTVWLNGGPGCSSMIGLWQENGPCRSTENGTQIEFNPYTWTQHSNMLFIDQPSGVGYSYGDSSASYVEDSAITFHDAIQLFYEAFPKYNGLPFHLFGESFAGRYIPLYAEHIVKKNLEILANTDENSVNNTQKIIPIDSVGIGNGWINPLVQYNYSAQMACESNYGQLLPSDLCDQMRENYGVCSVLVEDCYKTNLQSACVKAQNYCSLNIDGIFEKSDRNYYDVRQGSAVITPPADYVYILNDPDFQREIGVESRKFEECADKPYDAMHSAGESSRDSSPSLVYLLNNGIRVLNYAGDTDYICNWYGNYALTTGLSFNGSIQFNDDALKPWVYLGKEVGQIQSTELLTFIRVYEAGHEVPYYQPENSLAMFYDWTVGNHNH